MSKLFKSSNILFDDKKYVLNLNETIKPNVHHPRKSSLILDDESSYEEKKKYLENELKIIEESAQEEARAIVAQAHIDAKEIVENATISSEGIISQGYDKSNEIMEKSKEKGYSEGYEAGVLDGKNAMNEIINESLTIKNELYDEKINLYSNIEKESVELIINTVEKILFRKVEEDYTIVETLISKSIKEATDRSKISVRVSGEDYNYALNSKKAILAQVGKIEDIEIIQDDSLRNGSCIVDSERGSVDSSIWLQFDKVKQMFEQILKSE